MIMKNAMKKVTISRTMCLVLLLCAWLPSGKLYAKENAQTNITDGAVTINFKGFVGSSTIANVQRKTSCNVAIESGLDTSRFSGFWKTAYPVLTSMKNLVIPNRLPTSNVIEINLAWTKAAPTSTSSYTLLSIAVNTDRVDTNIFSAKTLKTFRDTIMHHPKEKAIYSTTDITIGKKIDTALQWLQQQVKGMTVTEAQLQQVFKNTSAERIKEVVDALNKYSAEFGIVSPERMAHFIGQIGAETGGLTDLKEKYNYTAQNIYDIFLKSTLRNDTRSSTSKTFKYCDLVEGYSCTSLSSCPNNSTQNGHANCDSTIHVAHEGGTCTWNYATFLQAIDSTKVAYTIKSSYVNTPDLFDYTYGCRMENGAKSTKDGSKYLGKGFIHLTGKSQYKTISSKWNELYPTNKKEFHGKDIDSLETNVDVAMKASMIFWDMKNLNSKADAGTDNTSIDNVGKVVNGSGKNRPNGADTRIEYVNASLSNFK
jgi:predicted chitinase